MNWNWRAALAAVISLLVILLGGHFTAAALSSVVNDKLLDELPGVAFAGFPLLFGAVQDGLARFGKPHAPQQTSLLLRPWYTTGLTAGAIMFALGQGISLLLGIGLATYENSLQAAGVQAAVFDTVPLAQRIGIFILAMLPIIFLAWAYFGIRIYASTRAHIVLALCCAVLSYAVFNISTSAMTPFFHEALYPNGTFEPAALVGMFGVTLLVPSLGLGTGFLVAWLRSYRSLARIDAAIRALTPKQREDLYDTLSKLPRRDPEPVPTLAMSG